MIKAVIFDFDGMLADSEYLWRRAEVKVFSSLGIQLTDADCLQTTGMRLEEVVAYWYQRFPWENVGLEQVGQNLLDEMVSLFLDESEPKPGAAAVLGFFSRQFLEDGAPIPVAIASASPCRLLEAAIQRFGWEGVFKVINSAQHEAYGKPHPAVYLATAKKLNVQPDECLAFEDSLPGLIAAKAARMKCVAVPEAHNLHDQRFALADVVLPSLEAFTPVLWEDLSMR